MLYPSACYAALLVPCTGLIETETVAKNGRRIWHSIHARDDKGWSDIEYVPSDQLPLHPGAHVLHYASTCFEGLKAFRHEDGSIAIFRMDRNVARFAQSSQLLALPEIDAAHTTQMINQLVDRFRSEVPAAPASMYIRPTHIGTEAAIGKAAAPSLLSTQYVLLSPVGDYFEGGEANLRLMLDDEGVRCGHDHGMVKGGGNYASALKHILRASAECNADQVLFCPGGNAQETGAANFISERELSIEELLDRASHSECEAGLTGTAAVVAAVGTFIYKGVDHVVGNGKPGPGMRALRAQLNDIQWGKSPDVHGWLTKV